MGARKDKKHRWNPTYQLVGYVMKEGKEHIRTKEHKIGRVAGKVEHIIVEEKRLAVHDSSEFVKFYLDADGINELIELSLGAQRIVAYLLKKLKFNEDTVYLSNIECSNNIGMDRWTYHKAMRELLDREWLFLSEYNNIYFINLCFVCKGNREDMYNKYLSATK